MKMTKVMAACAAAVVMTFGFAACGSSAQAETSGTISVTEVQKETAQSTAAAETKQETKPAAETASPETQAETKSTEAAPAAHSDVLVAYFSATGTTKGVAERIAAVTGGDLYEILAAEPYTADDLNYSDRSSRSTAEQNDKNARPAIGSADISLEGYKTVYLGIPIWWGEEPRILDTFVEKYSFEGITVIPFCTSGGSGIGRSGPNMQALAGNGTWLEGKRFSGNVSEEELKSWTEGLK